MADGVQTAFNVASGVVGIAAAAYGILFKVIFSRIKDVSQEKVDCAVCRKEHERIDADLKRGDEKFKALCGKIEKQTESLIKNNTLLALATQRLTALDGGILPARRKDDHEVGGEE